MPLEISLATVNKAIMIQAIILGLIFTITAVVKLFKNILKSVNDRQENIWRKKLIRHLDGKKTKFPDSFSFQCFLADYAHNFKGKYRLELDQLYMDKGFDERDKKYLKSFSRRKRLLALRRIDNMAIALPLSFLESLLSHQDTFFSSAVLFNMIRTHHRKAAPFVFSFFHGNQEHSKGVLVNLLKHYGKLDPQGLKFLLERVDTDYFQEALLTAIYYSPVENIDESIFAVVKNSAPIENKIVALRILDQYKSQKTLTLMNVLARQNNWVLKIYIAKMMHSYDFAEINTILKKLLEEENFHVRDAACHALMNFRPLSNREIEKILTDESHPSREILHHQLSVEQIEADYAA